MVEPDPAGGDEAQGARVGAVLCLVDALRQGFHRVLLQHWYSLLEDDRAGVHALIDKVHGTPALPVPGVETLPLRVQAGVAGQQRRVDVQQATVPFLDELAGQDPHVPGEADDVYLMRL